MNINWRLLTPRVLQKCINLTKRKNVHSLIANKVLSETKIKYFKNKSYLHSNSGADGLPLKLVTNEKLSEKDAYEMVCNFHDDEREMFAKALILYESQSVKAHFEGDLAAKRWRSKFGRPAKVLPILGDVDPSGQFCAVPEDWLQKKFAESTPEPTSNDLWKLGIANALPFVGFGFLDNFTMIIAGDYIESTMGMFMCISTMAAAGLGNTISDVLGIGSAFYIERGAEKLGVKPPKLTPLQLELKVSRRYANMGRVLGITIGCLLGMCPLLFMKYPTKDENKKKESDGESKDVPVVIAVAG